MVAAGAGAVPRVRGHGTGRGRRTNEQADRNSPDDASNGTGATGGRAGLKGSVGTSENNRPFRTCVEDSSAAGGAQGAKDDGRDIRRATKTRRARRPSPISILIELNATSYLMPETRHKLQLNARRGFTLSPAGTFVLIAWSTDH